MTPKDLIIKRIKNVLETNLNDDCFSSNDKEEFELLLDLIAKAEHNKLLELINQKMKELDDATKDCLATEDYASKCRFAHNVLKDIVKEIETNKGETK